MISVDTYIKSIVFSNSQLTIDSLANRDVRLLTSIAHALSTSSYITEKQGQLVIKIFKENHNQLFLIDNRIDYVLTNIKWDKPFRIVDTFKKLSIVQTSDLTATQQLQLDFSNPSLRKKIIQFKESVNLEVKSDRCFTCEFTEKNIVTLVELLSPLEFEIDEIILTYYNTIKSWTESEIKNQFLINTIEYPNFRKQLSSELGIDTPLTYNIIKDRSIRYQYFVEKEVINETSSLTEIIANRAAPAVWIDSTKFSLSNIFDVLIELKRLPTLVVFDATNLKTCTRNLTTLNVALEENNIVDNIGVYFRLDNNETGKEFNRIIAEKCYNKQLDINTKVVGIQIGKLPKFLLTSEWRPLSVISIGASLKNTKTAVYANCCDLNITYTESRPIIETRNLWV